MTGPPETFVCCGVHIAALQPEKAVAHLRALAQGGSGSGVHLCNAYTLALAAHYTSVARALDDDGLNLADGTPVAWVGRAHGYPQLTGPVRGPTLLLDVLRNGVEWGARHYFYGSTPAVVAEIGRRLPALVPGVTIVGLEAPPFRDLTDDEGDAVIDRVRGSGAHFVWVGLGTPRQDYFVAAFAPRWGAVTVGVGAAFDFVAGTVPEAPAWLHGTSLEWLYRLAREPRRLWRRYLFGNLGFLRGVARDWRRGDACGTRN